MNFGDSTDALTFNLAPLFTRAVRRFDFITISFRFVLLSLSLRRNSIHNQFREAYAKLIKKRVVQAIERILLLSLLLKDKFPWLSFPDTIIS